LTSIVAGLQNGVQIAQPAVGTYTLASNSAPLFVTVVNSLPVPVTVQVSIQTVNNIVGFSAQTLQHETIPARQQVSLRMAVKVQRAGRFQVDATLATPDGAPLGQPVRLQVRSTALGGIGVTITLVATGILVVALVVRFVRRFRHRRRPPPTDSSAPPAQPMAVSS
jgi:heme/copper-type cytochrome/quinol oxidase subunit 2